MRNKSLMRLAVCLIGMAAMVLQGCSESGTDRDKLCGSWSSVEGKPDVLVYKEGEAYKVTVFARSGKMRRLRPQTYLLVEENGNLFINTGHRIDISYNEAADVLTFSPNGDYVRKEERNAHESEVTPDRNGTRPVRHRRQCPVGGDRSR